MSRAAAVIVGAALLACCGSAPRGSETVRLPNQLDEVSGLAAASQDTVFTHNDESAVVHEVDVRDGRILRSFALGDPTLEGDFEGIAYVGGTVFLITSDGLIYSAKPGQHGTRVPYAVADTTIGSRCEIEGLSEAPEPGALLIVCKRLRQREGEQRLEIWRWRIGASAADPEPWLRLPLDRFLKKKQRAEFGPSGIEWDAARKRLLVLSARNRLLVQLDPAGKVLSVDTLDRSRHPQAEGAAILPGCRLVLADEGTPTRSAQLAVYPCP